MKTESMNEKVRLDSMVQNGQITKAEYQTLVDALEKKDHFLKRLLKNAVNPFQKLSSTTNILIGCISILIMGFIGSRLGLHFRGVLDFQIIQAGKPTFSFLELLIQNIVDVFVVGLFFYIGAMVCRCKNIRFVDFISSVTYSRLPYAAFALILFVLEPVIPNLLPRQVQAHTGAASAILAVIGILFLAWQITLLFSSLKESSGLKGKKLWLIFILALFVAEVVSYVLINLMLK